jgi:hypothetical protein
MQHHPSLVRVGAAQNVPGAGGDDAHAGRQEGGATPVEQRSRFIGGLALPIMAVGAKGHLERIKSANTYAVTSGSASFLMTMLD